MHRLRYESSERQSRPEACEHEFRGTSESFNEDERSPFHSPDECVLEKIENDAAAVAIWFMYYNFCRIHSTLRVTPAMEAGISDHVWSLEEMCALLPKQSASTSHIDKKLVLKALRD